MEVCLSFEAEVGEFESRELGFGGYDGGFFVVAPKLVEGNLVEM